MSIYFRDADLNRILVKKDISEFPEALAIIDKDLETRIPNFVSSYQKCWKNDSNELVIDYGSHNEFYIITME